MIKEVSKELQKNNIFHKLKQDYIITRKTKVKIPNISKNIAYLTGVIAGDGTLIKSKRKKGGFHYKLRIYSGSKDYLEKNLKLIKELFEYNGKIVRDKRKENTLYINIANAAIFYYFNLLDAKYKTNKISHRIKTNKKFLMHYIAGIIDTDGSVDHNRIQLKLKNKKFLEELYNEIKNINANPNPLKINYTESIPFYYIRFDNIFPLKLK